MGQVARAKKLIRNPREGAKAVVRRGKRIARTRNATPCLVCGSRQTSVHTVERPKRTYEVRVCARCSYVSNFDNTVDYTQFTSVDKFRHSARVGTQERPGREFHMGKMGVDILGRKGLSVMVFGAGRSLDYKHIGALPAVKRVVMSDVVDLGIDEDFINISEGTKERFDLIIACEVVEHFPDPRTEFPRLFDLLTKDGLLVCSTNIYDGGNFRKHTYLYLRGHVSYYSAKAISVIARRSKMLYDFRVPRIATTKVGLRKRYVLFARSAKVMENTALYFGKHPYAPSETPETPPE